MSCPKRRCVFGCTDLGAYMHSFPHPERRLEMFQKWFSIVRNKLKETDPLKIYKNKRVCSYHFTLDQKVASHRLNNSAVPTLYLDGMYSSPSVMVQLEHNYCIQGVRTSNPTAKTSCSTVNTVETDLEPEVTKSLDGPFTWQQKPYNVFGDDTEKVSDDESSIDDIFPRNESPLTEPRNISTDDLEPRIEHTDYVCNECDLPIYGARYKCVQCLDYDVCVACEARGVHATHYALRVPRGSSQDQVRRVIDAIKRCLDENEPEMMIAEIEEIKDEIKEETPDVEECDPLYTFDDQQVPKPEDIDINLEDRAQHTHLKTNASSRIIHQTVTNIMRKTDSNILRQTDNNILHKTDSNILEQYVNDSYIINHSDANLTQPNNTYLLDTNDINILQEIDKNVVSCQTDNNVTAQTNTYFLYENVLYQNSPTFKSQTSTNVTDQKGTNLINQTDINEIYLTGTKEVDQFGANIVYKNSTNKLYSLKTTNAHGSQVISDSSDISNSSKLLNQMLVPIIKTHLHTPENSQINPLIYKKCIITPVKRDSRGNLLLNL